MQIFTVLFFSGAEISIPLFEAVAHNDRFKIVGLVCQPDKPVGRDFVVKKPEIKVVAERLGVPVFQPENLKKTDFFVQQPDFILTFAYGQMFDEKWLSFAKIGALNVHASLLPKYRGASPLQAAILNGEDITGISLMRMEKKMDAGPVCAEFEIEIGDMSADDLHDAVADLAATKVPDALIDLAGGRIEFVLQNEADATYCGKVSREDGFVNFQDDAVGVVRKMRAYSSWPGLWTTFEGKRLKLIEVEAAADLAVELSVGQVACEDGVVFVGTKEGAVKLNQLQLEGKQPLSAADFIIGQPKFCSATLPS